MKKFLITTIFVLMATIGFSQQRGNVFTVPHNTTAFGMSLPASTIVLCVDSNMLYRLTAIGLSTGSLSTTAHVNLTSASIPDTTTLLSAVQSISAFYAWTADSLGKRYIATATAGTWTKNYIYEAGASAWVQTIPVSGDVVSVIDSLKIFMYSGTAWVTSTVVPTTVYWAKPTPTSTNIVNTNLGSVGIGMNPTSGYKLMVNGSLYASSFSLRGYGGLYYNSTTNSFTNGVGSVRALSFITNSLERVRIEGDGRVKFGGASNYYYFPRTIGNVGQALIVASSDSTYWGTAGTSLDSTTIAFKTKANTFDSTNTFSVAPVLNNLATSSSTTDPLLSHNTTTGKVEKMAKLNILTYYLTHVFQVGTNKKTIVDSTFVSIDSLGFHATSSVFQDDDSLVCPTGISGNGSVRAYNSGTLDEAVYQFEFNSDGTVSLITNTTDVVTTDTDNKLCIIARSNHFVIKNRLGGSRTLKIKLEY